MLCLGSAWWVLSDKWKAYSYTTLSCSSLGWLAKQEIESIEFLNRNLLAYVYFPSQEQHSLWSEDLHLDSGNTRSVSLVLQLIRPCVVCLLNLQMTHWHFPECVIKYTGKQFSYWLVSLSCSWLIFNNENTYIVHTQEAVRIYFAILI